MAAVDRCVKRATIKESIVERILPGGSAVSDGHFWTTSCLWIDFKSTEQSPCQCVLAAKEGLDLGITSASQAVLKEVST